MIVNLLRKLFRVLFGWVSRPEDVKSLGVEGGALLVSDLDAMVAKPVAFRLLGKVHYLRPVTTKEFFAYSNALLSFEKLKGELKDEEILDLYVGFINSVCSTVSRDDVRKMTHAQAGALIKLIVDHVTGKAHAPDTEETEKKN